MLIFLMHAYHDKACRKSNSAIQKLLQARIGGSHLLQVCAYCECQKGTKAHIYTCKYCVAAAFKGVRNERYRRLQGNEKMLTCQISKQESLPGLGSGLGCPCLDSLQYPDRNLNHAHGNSGTWQQSAVSLHFIVTLA